ncbi:MAG: hypothetical protein HDKAJFGB_01463 [Anaerolineae bacterium]|nr:hypothetical protein [Anaerolineae bacterium]
MQRGGKFFGMVGDYAFEADMRGIKKIEQDLTIFIGIKILPIYQNEALRLDGARKFGEIRAAVQFVHREKIARCVQIGGQRCF